MGDIDRVEFLAYTGDAMPAPRSPPPRARRLEEALTGWILHGPAPTLARAA